MTIPTQSDLQHLFGQPSTLGGLFVVLWLIWRMKVILLKESHRSFTGIWSWITDVKYLFYYADDLQANYVSGIPYTISTSSNTFVHISSAAQVEELGEVPEGKLSLVALAEDMLRPKYTMDGFEVLEESVTGTSLQHRVLRTLLTANLLTLHAGLQRKISESFDGEIYSSSLTPNSDWTTLRTFPMAKNVVRTATSFAFFGEQLSNDPVFLDAALQYPESVFMAAEALRYVPDFLAPTVVSWITQNHRASKVLVERLTPVIDARTGPRELHDLPPPKPNDCLQWIIDAAPRKNPWPTSKLIQITLGLWWASIHQLSMTLTNALYDLCEHVDYIDVLRDELGRCTMEGRPNDLPLMDSFLKESARLHPADTVSMRRKALSPYTFKDGLHIPTGSWVCAPSRAMMRDPANYVNPASFDGFRFVDKTTMDRHACSITSISKYTDTEPKFLFWSHGRRACPGRFYASHVLKLILRHILLHYDIKLADKSEPRTFAWRTAIVPRENTRLLARRRKAKHMQY
ncbi:hypothetical protein JMJ35_001055 [Cladonia borealis]|uniref:Cytochrome P450 n=1 Tax=Cladonia borealis TaxID=184061 RepID=A0AA39R7R4_9LECA|nr:hypothetical protein JMJ35_001055 [Cladonia borealis]